MTARWIPAADGSLSGHVEITVTAEELGRMASQREADDAALPPWWTDDHRMLEPLFLAAGDEAAIRKMPKHEAVTHVWPGEPGYVEATQKMIDGPAAGVLEWEDRVAGTVRACGTAVGVLRHGYITHRPMFSRTGSGR